ncbi:MAG TPA: hypothetical protein VG734_01940 [Lacunisphaera sp.]|nr:hypothetical protein [Lacunisphaera sp.]
MNRFLPSVALLVVVSLFAGCASYETHVDRNRSLTGVRHFFVIANANDNHGLNQQIVAALTARGLQAETGPLTMMPDETVAIVSYQDHWTWDFGDHLVYLQITMKDRKSGQPFGSATFSAKIPTRKTTAEIAASLIEQILPRTS